MEEDIPVRYTFVMMLAIADPTGLIVGTDVAIARRLNMPVEEFKRCADALSKPDEHSNSKELEGRRVIRSDGERGYQVVNYEKYRDLKTEEERREYMREYMRRYRGKTADVNSVKPVKLTKSEIYASKSTSASGTLGECENPLLTQASDIYVLYPRKVGREAALRKIKQAIKEFGFEKVMEATKIYALAWKGEKILTFCPYPATWFGQKRFNDDPSEWVRHDGKPVPEHKQLQEHIEVPSI